jgi:hypothetical protein
MMDSAPRRAGVGAATRMQGKGNTEATGDDGHRKRVGAADVHERGYVCVGKRYILSHVATAKTWKEYGVERGDSGDAECEGALQGRGEGRGNVAEVSGTSGRRREG